MDRPKSFLSSYLVFLSISSLCASDPRDGDERSQNILKQRQSGEINFNKINLSLGNIPEEDELILGNFPNQSSSPSTMQRRERRRSQSFNPYPQPMLKKSPQSSRNRTVSCDYDEKDKTSTSPETPKGFFDKARRSSTEILNAFKSVLRTSTTVKKEEMDEKTIDNFTKLSSFATFDQITGLIETVSLPDDVKIYGQEGIKLMLGSTKFENFSIFNEIWLGLRDRLLQAPNSRSVMNEFDDIFKIHCEYIIDSFQKLKNYATFDQVMCLIKTVPLSQEALDYGRQGIEMPFRLWPEAHHGFEIVNNGWMCLYNRLLKAPDSGNAIGEFNKTFGLHRTGILVKTFATYCEVFDKKYSRKQVVEKVIDIHDGKLTMEEVVQSYQNTLTNKEVGEGLVAYIQKLQEANQLYQQALNIDLIDQETALSDNKLFYEHAINSTDDPDERTKIQEAFERNLQIFNSGYNVGNKAAVQAQRDIRFTLNVPMTFCSKCLDSLLEANGIKSSAQPNNSMVIDTIDTFN